MLTNYIAWGLVLFANFFLVMVVKYDFGMTVGVELNFLESFFLYCILVLLIEIFQWNPCWSDLAMGHEGVWM